MEEWWSGGVVRLLTQAAHIFQPPARVLVPFIQDVIRTRGGGSMKSRRAGWSEKMKNPNTPVLRHSINPVSSSRMN